MSQRKKSPPVPPRFFERSRVGVFILFLLTLAVFFPALRGAFVLDDESEIVQNGVVHSLDHLSTLFLGSTMNQGGASALGGIYYRPLMMVTFSLIWNGLSESPIAFHCVQLLLHFGCATLLLLLLRRWLTPGLALGISALFLVHPLNVEPAVYISSLQDPLFLFFSLAGLLVFTRERALSLRATFFGAVLFLCGLLSKETTALLMLLSAVYAWQFQRERFVRIFCACGATTAVYAVMRFAIAGLNSLTDATTFIAKASPDVRLMTVPLALYNYVWKFVFPSQLAVTEDWVIGSPTFWNFWWPLGADLGAMALAVFVGFRTREQKWNALYWVFLLWTALGLFLHSHILLPIDGTVSDRWFYMTSIGACAAVALAATQLVRGRALVALTVALVGAFGARSFVRTLDWKDGATLYAHDMESAPTTAYLPNNLGVEIFRQGDLTRAKELFEKSIELKPDWTTSWSNLGAIYQHRGDAAKAEECYARSIANGPYLLAYENYASLLAQSGRFAEAKKFLKEKALPQFPADAQLLHVNEYLERGPAAQ